jgi:putative FmdB family regulatory protein
MPIFEYQCNKCGSTEEHLLINNKDKDPIRCRECGGKLKKIMSKNSFQLLGSGWFRDSYGGGKKHAQKEKK